MYCSLRSLIIVNKTFLGSAGIIRLYNQMGTRWKSVTVAPLCVSVVISHKSSQHRLTVHFGREGAEKVGYESENLPEWCLLCRVVLAKRNNGTSVSGHRFTMSGHKVFWQTFLTNSKSRCFRMREQRLFLLVFEDLRETDSERRSPKKNTSLLILLFPTLVRRRIKTWKRQLLRRFLNLPTVAVIASKKWIHKHKTG